MTEKKARITIEVPPEIKAAAKEKAESRGLNLGSYLRHLLITDLEKSVKK